MFETRWLTVYCSISMPLLKVYNTYTYYASSYVNCGASYTEGRIFLDGRISPFKDFNLAIFLWCM